MKATRHAVLQLAWSVLSDLDLELVLERALDAARTITGARYAALGVLDEEKTELARFLTAGIDAGTAREIGPLPRGRGVLGELIRDPRPLRLDDVEAHPHAFGFPAAHPPMHSFLGVPIMVAGEPYGILYLTEKEGQQLFDEEDEETVVEIAEFAGVAIDHARRYEGSVARERSARRTANALEATTAIARTLAGQTELDVILDLIAKRGRALVSARAVLVELLEEGRLRVAAVAGEIHPELKGVSLDPGESLGREALASRLVQRVGEDIADNPIAEYGDGRLGFGFEDAIAVPLVFRGRTYGAMIAIDPRLEDGTVTEGDEELLEAFAASATIAVATARSVTDDRRRARLAAAEAERARWARTLHDDTLEGLADLRAKLEAMASADPEAVRLLSRSAVGQVDTEMARLRTVIAELRPPDLDREGIEPALVEMVELLRGQGVEVELAVDLAYEQGRDPRRLTSELETAVYRIVQEGLRNAAAHAPGARIVVEVGDRDPRGGGAAEVTVRVADDGPGFDESDVGTGFGLRSMRERVELLAGGFALRTAIGDGTEIVACLPASRRQEPGPRVDQVHDEQVR
ncbi:MAG: GAF domain-containing protein [Actinobacteria bacterium]|nr:GAF domain-containing protein [Actinomycetota bacterium]